MFFGEPKRADVRPRPAPKPSPQKSMTYPPVRNRGARSINVGSNPPALSQKASVGPAMKKPEISTVLLLILVTYRVVGNV
jgi:hypothetical protein